MRVPAQPSRTSSSEVKVSMSRSLVGSSRMRTFGSVISSRSSCSRRRSPPEVADPRLLAAAGEPEPGRELAGGDLLAAEGGRTARTSSTASMTRHDAYFSSSRTSWVRKAMATVLPILRRPRSAAGRRSAARSSVDLPAPLTPTMPTRSPGASRQVTSSRRSRSSRLRPTRGVHEVDDVLAEPPGRERTRATSSRGGGSSSISALAASMRNLGLLVRAGGPRRSQASSLRSRFARRSARRPPASRSRSAGPGRMPHTLPRRRWTVAVARPPT